jgi:SAM-dependent methyltransferase
MTKTTQTDIDRELKSRHATMWARGDYATVAADLIWSFGPILVDAAGVNSQDRVLDIATGTGNVAIPAALTGATVVASDLTADLLEAGKVRAAAVGATLQWNVADAEDLPYEGGEFDVVLSSVGIMFAPHHAAAAAELLRVTRPAGRIGLINWTPDGLIGQMLATMKPYAPAPPPGAQPPPLWGNEAHLSALFGAAATDLRCEKQTVIVDAFTTPAEFRDYFKANYGPTITVYGQLDGARAVALDADLEALGERNMINGSMEWEYLLVTATRASR